jgi:hypothetical protein
VPGASGAPPVFQPLAVKEDDVLAVVRATELGGLPSWQQAARRPSKRKKAMCATSGGFDLHARTRVSAQHRGELERLARYLLRPSVSAQRLRLLPDGPGCGKRQLLTTISAAEPGTASPAGHS